MTDSTSPSEDKIRVLLVDDQELVRAGFRMLIDSQPDLSVVGEAGDGQGAPAIVAAHSPDVALVDLAMPGTEGPELVTILRERYPELAIVVFSGSVEPGIEERVLALGADRFVPKGTPLTELAAVVREAAGLRHTDPT